VNSESAGFPAPKPEPYQQTMVSAAAVLRRLPGGFIISKQRLRQAEAVECVRLKRDSASQSLGFASRPFVLCGLPIKRPANGVLLHERRNGQFLLQVTGHPTYGLPWGQDRLVPLFLATLAVRQQRRNYHVFQRT